ncbi:internalin, putative, partial [hydrothermal vent metagenome]
MYCLNTKPQQLVHALGKRIGWFLGLSLMVMSAHASHFRGGQLNWTIPDPVNAPLTVEFTLITTWTQGNLCDFNTTVPLDFGDGTPVPSLACSLIASGTDSSGNVYEMSESSVTHTYAAEGNYLAFHDGNARIASLQNASSDPWRIESQVALGNGNTAAPQAILFTLNQMEIGGVQTLSFPMGDSDNDPLSCRFSTSPESSITTPEPILGNTISIASLNNLCTISWDTTGGNNGDLYAISVAVESLHSAQTSSLTLDFILELVTSIPIANSISGSGDGIFVLAPGDSVSIDVTADHSADLAMDFTLLGSLPPGAVLAPASGSNNPDLTTVNLSYTAGFADQGNSYPMVFSFADSSNLIRNTNIIITVTPQDTDGDGILDKTDGIGVDTDGDGIDNYLDLDSDNDGITDAEEGTVDTDGDGVQDRLDLDSDNDGIYDASESGGDPVLDVDADGRVDGALGANGLLDALETAVDSGLADYNGDGIQDAPADTDADTVADFRDLDSDNDGITDSLEAGNSDPDLDGIIGTGVPVVDADGIPAGGGSVPLDTDTDGTADFLDLDSDGDGLFDATEAGVLPADDANNDGRVDGAVGGNGLPDAVENGSGQVDYDGDGTPDAPANTDGDGLQDYRDLDSDGDGVPDATDAFPTDAAESVDTDGDGVGDVADLDRDNDGILNTVEGVGDTDGDGIDDQFDLDSDNDGIYDAIESGANPALDGDSDGRVDGAVGSNGLLDALETAVDSGLTDYDGDTNPDAPADTDTDTVPDFQDLDSDNDSITDVLEVGGADADADGMLGNSPVTVDADGLVNGAGLAPVDTDADSVADFRDLDADGDTLNDIIEAGGADVNGDGIIDGFIDGDGDGYDDSTVIPASGSLPDTDVDGTPDFQDNGDLDGDGLADDVDIDDDNDGIPDSLEGNNITDTDGD